jgi:hypothetical protein
MDLRMECMQRNDPILLNPSDRTVCRRRFLQSATAGLASSLGLGGCVPSSLDSDASPLPSSRVDLIIGQRGLADGRFQKPRALAISPNDELYVIDKTARVQAFDANGKFLRGWKTPQWANGKPTGMTFDTKTNSLVVVDTHYFQFLFYTPDGQLLESRKIGGVNGTEPGQFGWVTDFARAPQGTIYLSEYGEYDRIYKYSADGEFIDRMGLPPKLAARISRRRSTPCPTR